MPKSNHSIAFPTEVATTAFLAVPAFTIVTFFSRDFLSDLFLLNFISDDCCTFLSVKQIIPSLKAVTKSPGQPMRAAAVSCDFRSCIVAPAALFSDRLPPLLRTKTVPVFYERSIMTSLFI
jgi:hypothetical protein